MVVSTGKLPDHVVRAISKMRVGRRAAVNAMTPLSLGQFPVENKVLNIAAVDIDGYRSFTGDTSANFYNQWKAVARGGVALSDRLEGKFVLDAENRLPVGADAVLHELAVTSYAPQVGSIDAVVNPSWGVRLGLPEDNALLLSTGLVSPQVVRTKIEGIIDAGSVSIVDLDIVAETGIDPRAAQTVVPIGSFADAVGIFTYTTLGGGRIAPDPAWVTSHVTTEAVPILGSVTCNRAIMPQLKAALAEVVDVGLADEIHPGEYLGCFYPRFIAGTTTLSNHSFGLALDINVPGNQRGTVGELDRGIVAIFKRWGFAWGGDWRYTDPMHFELARIVRPG